MKLSSIDTIFALSSGALPSGVAVIRLSGPNTQTVVNALVSKVPPPRMASLLKVTNPRDQSLIDKALVLWFPSPNSFTGEDCAEFHLHGGKAVVSKFLDVLGSFDNCRLAEAGEFSKRAFENGKFDLTEIEGLSDLIAAETEEQRKQAVDTSSGKLRLQLEEWRTRIIKIRALIEAELDFADEEDVPGSASDLVWADTEHLIAEFTDFLDDSNIGEIVRDGFRVVLMGAPNAGKSSLMNALANREIAIVSDEAGTTRDTLETVLDIAGYKVIITDTAGIRDTTSKVELEGIERARRAGNDSDLVLWLQATDQDADGRPNLDNINFQTIITKSDLHVEDHSTSDLLNISVKNNDIESLIDYLRNTLMQKASNSNNLLISRQRHREELGSALSQLQRAQKAGSNDIVFAAEGFRLAADHIGKLTGRVDVEDLLDVIFSEFCVGK
ncbi:MAG: tRNA uridine-5-carboxymethylaminomethyl(34) synthesis GTPase MnmE [Nitratireductor sp.]